MGRSLTPTPLTGALAAAILVPGLARVFWLVGTRGRDRRYAGMTPGVTAPAGAPEEAVPLVGAGAVAVQFRPPEGLRPGQIGTLLDEQANVLDVTATIVDLAVRGHLRIEELPRRGWFSSRDWRLVRLAGGTGELLAYEQTLYDGLFESGAEVALSALKKQFAERLKKVQTAMYVDVTQAGWFRGRPDQVRSRWQAGGVAVAVAGGGLTYLLLQRLHWAPVGIALTVVGLGLFAVSRRMPARTAAGSAVLAQARGFREYVRTAEAHQLRYEEQQDVFSRYLPYAIVFGETEHWVKVFGPLAAAGAAGAASGPAWYSGPDGWSSASFGDSLNGFTSADAGDRSPPPRRRPPAARASAAARPAEGAGEAAAAPGSALYVSPPAGWNVSAAVWKTTGSRPTGRRARTGRSRSRCSRRNEAAVEHVRGALVAEGELPVGGLPAVVVDRLDADPLVVRAAALRPTSPAPSSPSWGPSWARSVWSMRRKRGAVRGP